MTEVEYLTLEDLLGLVRRLGLGPVRDLGLLDSAVARPQSSAYGDDSYPTVGLKAAALLHSIVTNHALVDGDKRLGWLATTVFLDMNGETVPLRDDDAFQLVLDVAEGSLGVEDIADRLTSS
ncbi:MAG TPA: Fic family protein [Acidimicrobiia bacterium]|nr:Fic family protein [Acidimicrobiia bacterium]